MAAIGSAAQKKPKKDGAFFAENPLFSHLQKFETE